MGSGPYDASRAKTFRSTVLTDTVFSNSAGSLDPSLDISLKMRRESRDIDDNPSFPISIGIDVTGSMSHYPKEIFDRLPNMGAAIISQFENLQPQIGFAAIGDSVCDRVPFQVSEFEGDDSLIDSHISKFVLEGGGGGNTSESYEAFFFFLANCTEIDSFEKRGHKGLAFLIADEHLREESDPSNKVIFGGEFMSEPMKQLVERASLRWDIFILRPSSKISYYSESDLCMKSWTDVFSPQTILEWNSVDEIVSTISGMCGRMIGHADVDVVNVLKESGLVVSDTVKRNLSKSNSLEVVETVNGNPVQRI